MDWKPMDQAPKGSRVYAKDADGQEAWTWHDGTDWTRECWRETEDQQEYMSEEWWSPTEYAAGL
ncbi:hypothetical protein [Pseudorhodoferax sp. Leaf265]|uniref:hypothetical protein n=1 Tax=Pseudorhodoferax sp. Leaf265 TaxID=1736315 RepID=UPI0006F5A9AA|nr:hypothetical protein [Pseudorhodoferax sp. Leaf265]KQP02490.1 hypothetical protein ASF45_20770 [Pseudorhodoferax sp. Leaf265]